MTPGGAVRHLRILAGITTGDLAQAAGVGEVYLQRVESGTVRARPAWLSAVTSVIGDRLMAVATVNTP